MIDKGRINETLLPLLNKSMDAYVLRQKAIANNISNAETPGYRRMEVEFEEHLSNVLKRKQNVLAQTDERHLPNAQDLESIQVTLKRTAAGDSESNGVNSVDIDQEMASLARTLLGFRFASRMTRNEFDLLQKAITGKSY